MRNDGRLMVREVADWEPPPERLPGLPSPRKGGRHAEAVERTAERLLIQYWQARGPEFLPVPIGDVAAWMGFRVILLHTVPDEFSGLISIREKLIGVNGNHHEHRRRFSIAHELGHILLHHPPESWTTSRRIRLQNLEADLCAAELLMPARLLLPRLASGASLAELSALFNVSREALAVKIRRLRRR